VTPERWAAIGRVVDAAQELDPGLRADFLGRECAGDAEMRAEVESLLHAYERAGGFLETPPAAGPRAIGPYELLDELGRGGMGVVYRAVRRDQGFERNVALKLVKRGMDTDYILRRFEAERRILAGLEHPNIARLLDGGSTGDGLPYFVMELIEGRHLLRYCEEERLDARARLALFRQLCAAVQYAHQRLVIHRDIKPSNVLVTAEGVPKLLDFGVAKVLATEAGGETRTETALRALTPEYASPEQLRAETLTTATDVYSLGVVLHELLAGERPGRTPSATRRDLHRDLAAITARALSDEPARRYASAEQLSEDLGRHLDGRPVRARPDSFAYRAGKFARRNKLRLLAGALVAASLLTGLGVALHQARVARAERDHAQRESAKAQQVAGFLRGIFESLYPKRARGQRLSAQDLLDAGTERVDRELADQPELAASMLALLGSVYREIGLLDKARPLLTRSLAMRERLLGPGHADVAESLHALGRLEVTSAHYEAGRVLLERAVAIRERTGPPTALAESLAQLGTDLHYLGQAERERAVYTRAVAIVEASGGRDLHRFLTSLSLAEMARGDFAAARRLLERALEDRRRAVGRYDEESDVALLNLAEILRLDEEYAAALPLYEQALALDERMYGPDHQAVVYCLDELGEIAVAIGDLRRARDLLDRALATARRIHVNDNILSLSQQYSGRLLLAEGKPREARDELEAALRTATAAYGEGHALTAEVLVDLAAATARLSGPAAAEPLLTRALAIQRKVLMPGHRSLVPTLTALGTALAVEGRADQARPLLQEAVTIARTALPERHSQRLAAEQAARGGAAR